jgi:hypothetical protein
MKLFYRKKGKYADGRDRIVIEDREKGTSKALPKPEQLLVYLGDTKYTDLEGKEVSSFPKGTEGLSVQSR